MSRRRLPHDAAVLRLSLLGGLPAVLLSVALLAVSPLSARVVWTLGAAVICCWALLGLAVRERVLRPLQTLANLLLSLREGDYSMRARGAWDGDDLGVALRCANELGETLQRQRTGALEAGALLRAVMDEIDVAIFAFDDEERLRLLNRAGEQLLGGQAARLCGRSIEALGLSACLAGEAVRTAALDLPRAGGPFEVRRSRFRQDGRLHHLLVVTDLRRALREEERQAWQRLVRVLSHEINNSLAPIQSIADSLLGLLRRRAVLTEGGEEEQDLKGGLQVIARRAESLGRFLSAYARLARLPPPRLGRVEVAAWVRRVLDLEQRMEVAVSPDADPGLCIPGDGDQLDQMLINLVRNAVDAALQTGGGVRLSYQARGPWLELRIEDEGSGLLDTANLFVPFFTTKVGGSGIGLVLSRQIAEAHEGRLTLRDRAPGCEVLLQLPLGPVPALSDKAQAIPRTGRLS